MTMLTDKLAGLQTMNAEARAACLRVLAHRIQETSGSHLRTRRGYTVPGIICEAYRLAHGGAAWRLYTEAETLSRPGYFYFRDAARVALACEMSEAVRKWAGWPSDTPQPFGITFTQATRAWKRG